MQDFDDKQNQMSAYDAAKHFGVPTPVEKPGPDFKKMTKEELDKYEQDQLNSTDLYRIAARVKNLARGGGASLTSIGEMLCNSHTHVMKAFYDFADTLEGPKKDELVQLIRLHEKMPADVIAAAKVGVRK